MKIVVNKLVGDLGEQWALEFQVGNDILHSKDPVGAIKEAMYAVLRAIDDRLLEMNLRIMAKNKMAQSLTPEALMALNQTVQIMYGIQTDPSAQAVRQAVEKEVLGPSQPPPNSKSETAPVGLEKALEAVGALEDEGGQ